MEHEIKAHPFSSEKLADFNEMEEARRESQTLESVLLSDDLDFVLGKDGIKDIYQLDLGDRFSSAV